MYMELGDQDNQDQSMSMGFDIQEEMKKLMSAFMNRSDARGNTALHMAVLHKKMAAITYLLSNGAQPSLRALNEHHFTPLTLAVRSGRLHVGSLFTPLLRQDRARARVYIYGDAYPTY